MMERYQRLPFFGTLRETGRETEKQLEKIGNQGSG
jgi:hypothetical protein